MLLLSTWSEEEEEEEEEEDEDDDVDTSQKTQRLHYRYYPLHNPCLL
jgi:hypothetical protein